VYDKEVCNTFMKPEQHSIILQKFVSVSPYIIFEVIRLKVTRICVGI